MNGTAFLFILPPEFSYFNNWAYQTKEAGLRDMRCVAFFCWEM